MHQTHEFASSEHEGTLVNNGDGTFSYAPDPDYTGPDSFTYEICDAVGLCDGATVNITVLPDTDADGIDDALANCPTVLNVSQTDSDGDQIGDACEHLEPVLETKRLRPGSTYFGTAVSLYGSELIVG